MIEKLVYIFLTALITAFFASIIPRKLNERQKFIEAATEFRKACNQILADIQSNRFGIIHDDIIDTLRVAYFNFRPNLRGNYRRQYDEAWDICCYSFGHENDEKAIEDLLKFTEHSILHRISFWAGNLWFRLRLKILGPDKETKKLIEKICNHNGSHEK